MLIPPPRIDWPRIAAALVVVVVALAMISLVLGCNAPARLAG
jgi:hypothetical protein